MKLFYLISMGTAFVICIIAVVAFPVPFGNVVFFHLDAFGVTFHDSLNCSMVGILFWVFIASKNNYLRAIDVKHSTVIARK